MSLNRVLELSEANMSEGEYLEVANILRDIHNNTPPTNEEQGLLRYKLFDNTTLVCESPMCQCVENNPCCGISIPIRSIKLTRRSIHSTDWEVEEVEVFDKKIKYDRFDEYLIIKMKIGMSVDFTLYTDDVNEKMYFNFEKYVKFHIERDDNRWGEDSEPGSEEYIYNDYLKYIAEMIEDFLKLQRHI